MDTQDPDNAVKRGDGYDTLRVKAQVKSRVLTIQNDYFKARQQKISVSTLLAEALDARDRAAPGTASDAELKQKTELSGTSGILIAVPRGSTLNSKQLALFHDLAGKVAEVIARGSGALVGILTQGIEWAHRDLRPDNPKLEASLSGDKPVIHKARAGGDKAK